MLDTAEQHVQRMIEIFGDMLPNPIHQPIQFGYYVKLYKKFYVTINN